MDRLDFCLLVELHKDALQGLRSLARATGVTAPTVCSRLESLTASGALQGFAATVHPALFGRREVILSFAPGRPEKRAEDLLKLADVAAVAERLDSGLTVVVWSNGTTAAREAVIHLLGTAPIQEAVRQVILARTLADSGRYPGGGLGEGPG